LNRIGEQELKVARDLIYDRREFDGEVCTYDPLTQFTTLFENVKTKSAKKASKGETVEERLNQAIIQGRRESLFVELDLARTVVADDPPDSIESVNRRSRVRHRASTECLRVSVRDDLLHSAPVRGRAARARGRACIGRCCAGEDALMNSMNDNWMFVGAAFTVTWAVVLGYLFHVHRTLRRARALLDGAPRAGTR
jgi:hypothetical protein